MKKVYKSCLNCRFTMKILSRKQFIRIRSCGFLKKKFQNLIFSIRSRQKILFFDFLLWFHLYFATIPTLKLCHAKSLESVLAHCVKTGEPCYESEFYVIHTMLKDLRVSYTVSSLTSPPCGLSAIKWGQKKNES